MGGISDALWWAMVGCAALAASCWLLSILTGNSSWVDRIWSIAPPVYAGWFASRAGFRDLRLDVMFALALLWGARLTFNFARKGGYKKGGEDYRWPILRQRFGPVRYQLFNATFIAPFQNALILAFTLPACAALEHPAPFGLLDGVAAAAFLVFLVGETIADQQQWNFQSDKYARKARGEAVAAEFVTTGLFRYSRHPNFFCELSQWWCFYLFSVTGAGWLNWSIGGVAVLTLLFQGSTNMTESLSRQKYPSYADYQRTTSRLIPWFPGRS